MVLYVNIALAYCKLEKWTPVFFCYKIWLLSIQSYLRCSSVWYPPHTRVKKSKRKSLTKYPDLAQSNSRYFTSYYLQYLCSPCLPIVCGDFTTNFRNPYALFNDDVTMTSLVPDVEPKILGGAIAPLVPPCLPPCVAVHGRS